MATKTEELIHELTIKVSVLELKAQVLEVEAAPVEGLMARVAMLEYKFAELSRSRELWGQRGWGVLTVLLTAVSSLLGVVVGAVLNAYLRR